MKPQSRIGSRGKGVDGHPGGDGRRGVLMLPTVEGKGVRITSEMVMEVEGSERPALVAEVLGIQYA